MCYILEYIAVYMADALHHSAFQTFRQLTYSERNQFTEGYDRMDRILC